MSDVVSYISIQVRIIDMAGSDNELFLLHKKAFYL